MVNKFIKTRRQAFATHFGLDFAETEDFIYHPGRTTIPVYAFDNEYICVTNKTQKPAKHRDGAVWAWQEISSPCLNKDGWRIWEAKTTSN